MCVTLSETAPIFKEIRILLKMCAVSDGNPHTHTLCLARFQIVINIIYYIYIYVYIQIMYMINKR